MDLEDIDTQDRSGNIGKLHDLTAAKHSDLLALEMRGTKYTHSDVKDQSATFAGGLHEFGLQPGDNIIINAPNSPESIIASLGAFKAGTPFSPINPQYQKREVKHQIQDADATAIVAHTSTIDTIEAALDDIENDPEIIVIGDVDELDRDYIPFDDVVGDPLLVDRDKDDVAMLPYTSGTTGKPKGVYITHQNLWTQSYSALQGRGPSIPNSTINPKDLRSLVWVPTYHITGFVLCVLQPLIYGGSAFIRKTARWNPDVAMETIESERITSFTAITAMYSDIVNSESFGEYDLSSLEIASEGGAKLPAAIQKKFKEVTGIQIAEGYGATETTAAITLNEYSTFGVKPGTVGQPYRMVDCKIVDEDGDEVDPGEAGELLVRGPSVAKGYHNLPEANEEAFTEKGYFKTGDIARRDEENYYEIIDRKKNVIVSAGYNIYPSEIEELLHEHEAIETVVIMGVSDERRNEVPKAFIQLSSGYTAGTDVTSEEIKDYCLEHLAAYKHPRRVEFVNEFPRTESGKIRRTELVDGNSGSN